MAKYKGGDIYEKLILSIICILFLITACIPFQIRDIHDTESEKERQDTAIYALNMYLDLWQDGKYEDMYNLLSTSSKEEIDKEKFVELQQYILCHRTCRYGYRYTR